MKETLSKNLYNFAHILELVLAAFIAIGVLIGLIDVIKLIIEIFSADIELTYDIFKHFLSYILLLVVAVEFILMLLTHSIKTIGELIVFVIARKMLIYGSSMLDMVLGALAIACIFATLKYLTPKFEVHKPEESKETQTIES